MLSYKRARAIRPTSLARLAVLLVEAILQACLDEAESLGQIPMGEIASTGLVGAARLSRARPEYEQRWLLFEVREGKASSCPVSTSMVRIVRGGSAELCGRGHVLRSTLA